MNDAPITQEQFALLMTRLDSIEAHLAEERRRAEELEELKHDLIPIGNQMVKLTIDELAEIGSEFKSEDLLFLLKRVLRDTHLLVEALDQLEGIMGLSQEANRLMRPMFNTAVEELDRLERAGYFNFAREGWGIIERIVTEFSEEDVRALADNVVFILNTVRNMTQPDIMALANQSVNAIREDTADEKTSLFAILRELRNPKVRKGMGRLLNLLKTLGEQPGNVPTH
ncbi:MAG: hypothetical protein Fur0018_16010 [Anaerolineales bacterium]